jgi:hypothetical protein
MGRQPKLPLAVAAGAVLLLQVLVFSASWRTFFCGDSIYYLARVLEPAQWRYLFTHHDTQGAYRPLTYVVFTCLLHPLFGLRPLGYHLAAAGFAALNSLLVYRLLRRVVAAPAALAALAFFALHGVQFYASYDFTFLPDLLVMFCWLMALLAYSHYVQPATQGRPYLCWLAYAGSLAWFTAALLSKEIALMLPVSVAAWHVVLGPRSVVRGPRSGTTDHRPRTTDLLSVLPFFVCAALFLAWTVHLKHGLLYPGGPCRFTLRAAALWPKLAYAAWLANVPFELLRVDRRAWLAAVLAAGPAAWAVYRLARAWPARKWGLLACGAWAAAALAPLIVVTQVPMEHNLYVPLAAAAVALGISLDGPRSQVLGLRSCGLKPETGDLGPTTWDLRPFSGAVLAGVLACAAVSSWVQAQLNVRYSWVGAGSRLTKLALDSMRRLHPTLPRAAVLYLLPSGVRGNVAWYVDGGGLFQVFYHDPALRMLFADSGHKLPPDFASRSDVFVFRFADGRLYGATDYQAGFAASVVCRLLDGSSPLEVVSKLQWRPQDIPPGGPVYRGVIARGDVARDALVMLPGTEVRFPVSRIPAGAVLRLGLTSAGAQTAAARVAVYFESEGRRELVTVAGIDSHDEKDNWWDAEVSLGRWAGRSGTLVAAALDDPAADWLALSLLRIETRADPDRAGPNRAGRPAEPATVLGQRAYGPGRQRLLDSFDPALVSMDRSEPYADFSRFDTPTGRPAFLHLVGAGGVARFALVTLAGARVSFPLSGSETGHQLHFALAPALNIGKGVEARIVLEARGKRQTLFSRMVLPGQPWQDLSVPLAPLDGPGTLVLECDSEPSRDVTGAWLAWGKLQIEPQ